MRTRLAGAPIRVCDLADDATLEMKVDRLLAHHNALLKGLGAEPLDGEDILKELRDLAPKLLPYAEPCG